MDDVAKGWAGLHEEVLKFRHDKVTVKIVDLKTGSGTTDECFSCSGIHSSEIGECVIIHVLSTKKQSNSSVNTKL